MAVQQQSHGSYQLPKAQFDSDNTPLHLILKGVVTIKRSLSILIVLCCLMLLPVTVQAAGNPVTPKTTFDYRGTDVMSSVNTGNVHRTDNAYFKDEADVLPSSVEGSVWEMVQETANNSNLCLAVFLGGNYRTDNETEDFTYDGAAAIFGSKSDILFIYLDFEGRSPAYDYVRAFNRAESLYTNTKTQQTLNTMYRYLPKSGEPIYADDVKQALFSGLEYIRQQGTVRTSTNNYNSYTSYSHNNNSSSKTEAVVEGIKDFLQKIPKPVIFGAVIVIIILAFIVSIKSRFRRNTHSNYYSGNDPYHHNNYYGGSHSSYSRRSSYRRPPRRSSRPPRRTSSHSSRSSSGSGQHR